LEKNKLPSYWNSTSGFDFDHTISPQSACHCASVCPISPKLAENDVMSIFKMADLGFYGSSDGSLKSPYRTSSIVAIALNCLVLIQSRFSVHILATDGETVRQADKQMDRPSALSRSRCHERRLNKWYHQTQQSTLHTQV